MDSSTVKVESRSLCLSDLSRRSAASQISERLKAILLLNNQSTNGVK